VETNNKQIEYISREGMLIVDITFNIYMWISKALKGGSANKRSVVVITICKI